MIWSIVPAKLGTSSKERLAPVLSAELRARLAGAMLTDVVQALVACEPIETTLVVSRDDRALDLAETSGALPLRERGAKGLNESVRQAIDHAAENGATTIVIAMGDLPLLRPEHVRVAVERAPARGVVLVPSADGTGTNLAVVRPPTLLDPRFGPGSLALHLEQLRERSVQVVTHECSGAALDVDTPDDLSRLRTASRAGDATRALLAETRDPASATA